MFLTTRRHRTGSATARPVNGTFTTIAATTQLLPNAVAFAPAAEPSWNHEAAHTFFPRRLNKVSSTATSTAVPSGTSSSTAIRASPSPSRAGSQDRRAKNECARSCGHRPAMPAPDSIPRTARVPEQQTKPATSTQNVSNDGAVNTGRNRSSSSASDGGTAMFKEGSIGVLLA